MKSSRPYLALLVLTVLFTMTVACSGDNEDVEDQKVVFVTVAPTTVSLILTPRVSDTPTNTPALEPTADQTITPEPSPTATPCILRTDWVLYTVQSGETLGGIATLYTMTVEDLQQANCLSSADLIQAGQEIYVPFVITPSPTPCTLPTDWVLYTVRTGETLFSIALPYGMTDEELQQANCLASDMIQAGQDIYVPFIIATPIPTLVPTPIPTPIPTLIPTPIPTERPDPVVELKEEIFFDPGGEREEAVCDDPDPNGDSLQITISGRLQDNYKMCVYGFLIDEEIIVELYEPNGDFISSHEFLVSENFNSSTIVRFDLWMPVGLPTGLWSAIVKSADNEIQSSFDISRFTEPAINTWPGGDINPFEKPPGCNPYQLGEQVVIHGTNFGADQNFALGIYVLTSERDNLRRFILQLVRGQEITTDSRGDFSTTSPIELSDSTGDYLVILATDANADVFRRIDANNDCYRVP